MKTPILALRLSRRAIGAVVLGEEDLVFRDGRHLTSRRVRALAAAKRYIDRVVELTSPAVVVVDAPVHEGSTNSSLLAETVRSLSGRGLSVVVVPVTDVLHSFGLPGVQSRRELREIVLRLWPSLADMVGSARPYVIDAVAVAFFTEVRDALGHPRPA